MEKINKILDEKRYQEDMQAQQERWQEYLNDIKNNTIKYLAKAGIPARYQQAKLEGIKLPPRIINDTKHFLDGKYDGLFITGTVGSGKTYLSSAVAREIILRGQEIFFQSVPVLFQKIRAGFGKYNGSEEMLFKKMASVDLLILDDMGAEKVSDFTIDRLYLIVDDRYANMKKVIITSNLSLNEVKDKIHDRLASRISEMCKIIIMPDKDLRVELRRT
ncbi:MAG TPA: ATP-binding protein [Victivallales bacterium]|nr:ATP-binding protein [Victivallales bacterium]